MPARTRERKRQRTVGDVTVVETVIPPEKYLLAARYGWDVVEEYLERQESHTRSVPQDSIMQCPEDRPRRPAGARAADGSRPRGRGDREFIYLSAARGCRSCSA